MSVMNRCINPYEQKLLPEFEQEALVVTTAGLRGYQRAKVPERRPGDSLTVCGRIKSNGL